MSTCKNFVALAAVPPEGIRPLLALTDFITDQIESCQHDVDGVHLRLDQL